MHAINSQVANYQRVRLAHATSMHFKFCNPNPYRIAASLLWLHCLGFELDQCSTEYQLCICMRLVLEWTKPGNDHQFRNLFNQTGFQGLVLAQRLFKCLPMINRTWLFFTSVAPPPLPLACSQENGAISPGSKTQHDRVAIWGMLPIQAEQASYRFCHAPNGARKGDSLQTLALGPGAYQGA